MFAIFREAKYSPSQSCGSLRGDHRQWRRAWQSQLLFIAGLRCYFGWCCATGTQHPGWQGETEIPQLPQTDGSPVPFPRTSFWAFFCYSYIINAAALLEGNVLTKG